METILYLAIIIAALAVAWFFLRLGQLLTPMRKTIDAAREDLDRIAKNLEEIQQELKPAIADVRAVSANLNSITTGIQTQMIRVHETIDDTLDVVRGTVDDFERMKDQLVATVEPPIAALRSTSERTTGKVIRAIAMVAGFFQNRNRETRAAKREARAPKRDEPEVE